MDFYDFLGFIGLITLFILAMFICTYIYIYKNENASDKVAYANFISMILFLITSVILIYTRYYGINETDKHLYKICSEENVVAINDKYITKLNNIDTIATKDNNGNYEYYARDDVHYYYIVDSTDEMKHTINDYEFSLLGVNLHLKYDCLYLTQDLIDDFDVPNDKIKN